MKLKTKFCPCCKQTKPLTEFRIRKDRKLRFQSYCIICLNLYVVKYRREHPLKHRIIEAKRRSKQSGLKCTIQESDFKTIPSICPVLGIPLNWSSSRNWITIDRFDSTQGYTKENCHLISHRANNLKSNATLEELEKIVKWMRKIKKQNERKMYSLRAKNRGNSKA